MHLSRLVVVPLVAGVALGLAACNDKGGTAAPAAGDGGKAAASSAPLDLCGVITLERAKKVIGDDAKLDRNDAGECSYNADSTGYSIAAHVQVDPDGTQWDLTRRIGGEYQSVPGVGDEALFRSYVDTLWVRKGKNILDVQVVQGPGIVLEATKQLAAEILK